MLYFDFPVLHLQLLADGADGAAGTPGVTADAADPHQSGVKEDYSKILYGKQEQPTTDAAGQNADAAPKQEQRDLAAEFDALIQGEFKDVYGKKMSDAMQKARKGSKEIDGRNKAMQPIMDRLASRYGLQADQFTEILSALDDDDALYEAEAAQKGLTVDTLKAMKKVEFENDQLRREMEERQRQEGQEQIYAQWVDQAEQVRGSYPDFDLAAELANEQFSQLLLANIDMKTAYEVIHHDEVMPAAMQFAARQAEQKVVNNVMAGAMRPRENGISQQAGVITKSDPSKLSFKDIDEIKRRVLAGERITFG